MTNNIPDDWDLEAEVIGALFLVEVGVVDGDPLRFVLEDEASFVDSNEDIWVGANLVSISDVEFSIDGTAPDVTLEMSYTTDMPMGNELMSKVQELGLSAVKGEECKIYIQHLRSHEEFYVGADAPVLLTSRRVTNVGYRANGPKTRGLSISIEGPWNLRSKPVNGTYNSADQRRRTADNPLGPDPSLDVMPTNDFDAQALFGL